MQAATEEMMTRKDMAKFFKCTPRHIDKLVKDNQIPRPIRLGSSPRWRRSSVLSWMNDQESGQ